MRFVLFDCDPAEICTKPQPPAETNLWKREEHMRANICAVALGGFGLVGCVVAPPPEPTVVTTTTTEVRREVVNPRAGTGPVIREVVVTRPPPAVRVERVTTSPGAQYVWTRGYWRWTGADYVWVPGSYIVRPRTTAVWVDNRWERRSSGWVFVAGHWE